MRLYTESLIKAMHLLEGRDCHIRHQNIEAGCKFHLQLKPVKAEVIRIRPHKESAAYLNDPRRRGMVIFEFLVRHAGGTVTMNTTIDGFKVNNLIPRSNLVRYWFEHTLCWPHYIDADYPELEKQVKILFRMATWGSEQGKQAILGRKGADMYLAIVEFLINNNMTESPEIHDAYASFKNMKKGITPRGGKKRFRTIADFANIPGQIVQEQVVPQAPPNVGGNVGGVVYYAPAPNTGAHPWQVDVEMNNAGNVVIQHADNAALTPEQAAAELTNMLIDNPVPQPAVPEVAQVVDEPDGWDFDDEDE